MLCLLLHGAAAAPLAGQVQQQATSIVPSAASEVDGTIDVANAAEPDDCICCERSLAAMTRYCKAEMVRHPGRQMFLAIGHAFAPSRPAHEPPRSRPVHARELSNADSARSARVSPWAT